MPSVEHMVPKDANDVHVPLLLLEGMELSLHSVQEIAVRWQQEPDRHGLVGDLERAVGNLDDFPPLQNLRRLSV